MKILRELRERAELTLREVEDATQISNAYLSQLENGKIKSPSANVVYKLGKLYGVDSTTLLIKCGIIKNDVEIVPVMMLPTIEQRLNQLEEDVKQLKQRYSLPIHPINYEK